MSVEKRDLGNPEETRAFPKGRMEVVRVGGITAGKVTIDPGWRWSECVKPLVGTKSCMVHHNGYVISGRMRIQMDDGQELEVGPGDIFECTPGHDAWVIGNEPCVSVDFSGGATYAKAR